MNVVGISIGREENKHNSKERQNSGRKKDSVKRNERRSCGERKASMGRSSPPPNAGSAPPPYRVPPKSRTFGGPTPRSLGCCRGISLGPRERDIGEINAAGLLIECLSPFITGYFPFNRKVISYLLYATLAGQLKIFHLTIIRVSIFFPYPCSPHSPDACESLDVTTLIDECALARTLG